MQIGERGGVCAVSAICFVRAVSLTVHDVLFNGRSVSRIIRAVFGIVYAVKHGGVISFEFYTYP